jgi:hypothetical protein
MSDRTTLGDRGRFRSRIGVWSRNALQVYKLAIARLPKPIDLLVIASLALLVAASAMFALLLSGPMPGGQEGYPLANSQSFERIQRGRYLVILADCAPVVSDSGIMRAGSAIYKDSCAAYHKDSGAGESDLFPRLARSALVIRRCNDAHPGRAAGLSRCLHVKQADSASDAGPRLAAQRCAFGFRSRLHQEQLGKRGNASSCTRGCKSAQRIRETAVDAT